MSRAISEAVVSLWWLMHETNGLLTILSPGLNEPANLSASVSQTGEPIPPT